MTGHSVTMYRGGGAAMVSSGLRAFARTWNWGSSAYEKLSTLVPIGTWLSNGGEAKRIVSKQDEKPRSLPDCTIIVVSAADTTRVLFLNYNSTAFTKSQSDRLSKRTEPLHATCYNSRTFPGCHQKLASFECQEPLILMYRGGEYER